MMASDLSVRVPCGSTVTIEAPSTSREHSLFVHEGARQSLERRLSRAFGCPAQLSITDNRRKYLWYELCKGVIRVRLDSMFLGASKDVIKAAVECIRSGAQDKEANAVLDGFIDKTGYKRLPAIRVSSRLRPVGKHHDLSRSLSRVSKQYYANDVGHVLITWSRRGSRPIKTRDYIKLGYYYTSEHCIRIHPSLDQPWVPRYVIDFLVYHELIHHMYMPGSRNTHDDEFHRRESLFPSKTKAEDWIANNVYRLTANSVT